MYYVHSSSKTEKSNLSYYESDLDQDYQLYCLTLNLTENDFLNEVNDLIIESIKSKNFKQFSSNELKRELRDYFIDLNWQLYSKFSKNEDNFEFGISSFLGIVKDNMLYFVQFGRMLCGKLDNENIIPLGKKWDNVNIKTVEDLFLLGARDQDIFVKVLETSIFDEELFFTLPSFQTEELDKKIKTIHLKREVRKLYRRQNFPYLILSAKQIVIPEEPGWLTKLFYKIIGKKV